MADERGNIAAVLHKVLGKFETQPSLGIIVKATLHNML